ncbi:MAG: hypothetical protein J5I94_21070 [Phaeodactylibacter sp.]|nr:hypothetical protein [Phaeodactylibacter sp.]
MRILSYEYLQWRARQLATLPGELDPHNLHRLLRALDRLDSLLADLEEVLVHSGNKNTASYEAATLAEKRLASLRALLEGMAGNDEELEHGILLLQQALYGLARALQAKLAVAFPFSMN